MDTTTDSGQGYGANLQQFGIRRLVLVNAGQFSYAEIPLDRHALLIGTGNLGKSSLLNSLRLFLLPENNFKKSQTKFAFRNAKAGGFYTNEQSYDHYFPSAHSFLILEVENPAGVHCQILYRDQGSRLSYGRVFASTKYDQLRDVFWNTNDPDGIGYAVEDLTQTKVFEAVKRAASDVRFHSDPAKLKAMLYNSDLLNLDEMRYSVLPLAEVDERKIQSLRTLILMLFEMKADDSAMTQAIASIVEADKKYATDEFNFDIDRFLETHEDLKAEEQRIIRIESQRPTFQALEQDWAKYQQLQQSQHKVADFREGLAKAIEQISKELAEKRKARDQADEKAKNLRADKQKCERSKGEQDKVRKSWEKTLTDKLQVKTDGDLLLGQYANKELKEIREILNEELGDQRERLKSLENEGAAEERRGKLTDKIEKAEKELEELADRKSRAQWQLHQQLDQAVIKPLAAVNRELLNASPGRALSAQEKRAIEAFTELFGETQGGYEWFDRFLASQEIGVEDIEAREKEIQDRVNADRKELRDLSDSASASTNRPQRIKETNTEIRSMEKDLATLEKFEGVDNAIKEAREKIAEAEQSIAEADRELAEIGPKEEEAQEALKSVESEVKALQHRETDLRAFNTPLKSLEKRFPVLARVSSDQPLDPEMLTRARFEDLEEQLNEMEDCRNRVVKRLRDLLNGGVLDDTHEGVIEDSPSRSVMSSAFQGAKEAFEGLEKRWEILRERVDAHNETVASYQQALKVNEDHIRRFENQLNRELDGVTINDLVEIRIDIETDPKFRNLVEESETIDPYGNQMVSDAFYDRLRVFVSEFFHKDQASKHLTMERVITGVSYRTRKANAKNLDTKGQSTSTTALVNLELVYRLLRRVLYPGIGTSFPMVLDELASIDLSQIPSLLQRLSHQGFNLFAAATHSASPELTYQVGRHLEIGRMRTEKPFDAERTLVFWGGPEGFTRSSEVNQWISSTQEALWEG